MTCRPPEPDGNPDWERLLEGLAELWAAVPAGEDGLETAAAHIRAAYGIGYVEALEGR